MKKFTLFILLVLLSALAYFILNYIQEPFKLNSETRSKTVGKYITLSKGTVHYQTRGDINKPLIILIGGGGLGFDVWDRNIDYLSSKGFRVLRYDHYGRGYSDKVNGEYSLDLFYNQFIELIDSLDISGPFHLAGLSMGAMIAIKYTLNSPEKVKKLILIDPAGVYPFKAPFVLKTPILADLLMTFYWRPKAIQKQIEEFYEPEGFSEYKKELENQIKLKGYKKVQRSIWLNTLNIDMSEEIKKLGYLNKSVMLIWGKQDPRTLFETHKFYLEVIPNITFLPVDKAGHLSNYERPEIVNPPLLRFLKN